MLICRDRTPDWASERVLALQTYLRPPERRPFRSTVLPGSGMRGIKTTVSGLRRTAARGALVALAVLVALACAEGLLRVGGFSYHNFPTVQFGWPEPKSLVEFYQPDRDLFWVTK